MSITRRQLRRLIREATAPSLESLFGGFYDSSMLVSHAIIKIVKNNPGLEGRIRKALEALGPLPERDVKQAKKSFEKFIRIHLDEAQYSKGLKHGSPEWAEFASDFIRQAGIEAEFIDQAERQRRGPKRDSQGFIIEPDDPKTGVEIATNVGTDLTVDAAASPDDVVDSISGNATDPAFLRQLAGWLQQMDKNPAVQTIMYNLD